ncbi:E3 ubiquitin-protein ligase RNF5 [Nematocida major]|uniref:E3 ubiquitin-protein ligase RNF5 n=1 Tax=Nematocida major TaxID=1912982 RepID=UPI002008A9A0|nr:E3 ubiquitin-protein ligase RNF5 [Nematocida major]KAH9386746.1 E3 ubiquitin-protein ligase RNF5 [Nematocida major]
MQEEVISRPIEKRVDFDCSICMCDVEIPVVTQCGHLFCWGCIQGWSEKSSICPVCKATCSISAVIPIYSKGNTSSNGFFPKPQEPASLCRNPRKIMGLGYVDGLRVFHMQGVEYRGLYGRQCFLTKIFYIILLLFFIMIFLILE